MYDITHITAFLACETPDSWVQWALQNEALLLLDHANCEKKAASTALALMYQYVDDFDLMHKMSRLAREELRHYEQVMTLMMQRSVPYTQITPCRYASKLSKPVRTHETYLMIDSLIVGSIIETHSCEHIDIV